MPTPVIRPIPQDYTLDDLYHFERWMCTNCGLILDYMFDPEEAGWPKFDPPIYEVDFWVNDKNETQIVELERKEYCPRCNISFEGSPPIIVIIRDVKVLSDFFQPGDGEGLNLELKVDFTTDHIRNTMAAFATTQGGKIILGITNQGIPVGYQGEEKIETTEGKDRLQERICGLLSSIEPKVQYRVYFVDNKEGNHFAVIVVPKGSWPLYSVNGRYYIRIGSQTRGLASDEILEITKSWHVNHKR
jgi:hypothetical protein